MLVDGDTPGGVTRHQRGSSAGRRSRTTGDMTATATVDGPQHPTQTGTTGVAAMAAADIQRRDLMAMEWLRSHGGAVPAAQLSVHSEQRSLATRASSCGDTESVATSVDQALSLAETGASLI